MAGISVDGCEHCQRDSPVYTSRPCCRERWRRDSERHAIGIEACRILEIRGPENRRREIELWGGDKDALKAEVERRWHGRKGES